MAIKKQAAQKKYSHPELKQLLEQAKATLAGSDFSTGDLTLQLNKLLETTGQKPAVLFGLVRISVTQSPASPGLSDTLAVLGKDISMHRIDAMLAVL